jgi:pyruvate kinase
MKTAVASGLASLGDKIVLAAGLPLESPVPLNTVRVLIIGNILGRSRSGGCASTLIPRASGRIVWAESAEEARQVIRNSAPAAANEILACPVLTEDYIPILRIVAGVICEGECKISEDIIKLTNPRLVWLSGVHSESAALESGLAVTIDSQALLVYEGTI